MPKPPSQPGCSWVEECIEECDGPTLYVEDRGVRATFLNPRRRRLRKVHYDGCHARTGSPQADYIVGLIDVIDVVVELKGSDANIQGAAVQVENTIHAWKRGHKACSEGCSADRLRTDRRPKEIARPNSAGESSHFRRGCKIREERDPPPHRGDGQATVFI